MTIFPYLKKKYSTDNEGIINIRITRNRKSEYISTKIRIHKRYWNEKKKEIRSNHPEADVLKSQLDQFIEHVKGMYPDQETSVYNRKESFIKYLEDNNSKLLKRNKLGTLKRYNTVLNQLNSYLTKNERTDLLFANIDLKWIESFDDYLHEQNISQNSRNTYIKCIKSLYNHALKVKDFRTFDNPFIQHKFSKEPVEKRRLSMGMVQSMINQELDINSKLYEIRNKFLIQVYGQGLRVSDMLTLRYKQIVFDEVNSRIDFIQFKTKKPHTVQLSLDLTKLLLYYIDKDKLIEFHETAKYDINWKEKDHKFTLPELNKQLRIFLKKSTASHKQFTYKVLDILWSIHVKELGILKAYASKHPNQFIVPWLKEGDFTKVEFDKKVKLTRYQNNQIQSKTTMYNKELKKLGKWLETNIRITTHTARHTYTNLMLASGADIYSISKSLGHSRLAITEAYLKDFDQEKVGDDNSNLWRVMNLSKMALSTTEKK